MGKLKSYQQRVQHLLESGINTAEQRHKQLISRPFDLAEKVEKEAKAYSVKSVREAHNQYATNVYSSLRSLNERANSFAAELISRLEKEAPSVASETEQKSTAKKTATRKPATAKKAAANGQEAKAESNTASA